MCYICSRGMGWEGEGKLVKCREERDDEGECGGEPWLGRRW